MSSFAGWLRDVRLLTSRRTPKSTILVIVAALFALAVPGVASASLNVNYVFNGHGDYSADGMGSTSGSGTLRADVPAGSTVERAFLYETFSAGAPNEFARTVTFEGQPVVTQQVPDSVESGYLTSSRADVTDVVKAKVGSAGGITNFSAAYQSTPGEGVALVVVYANPLLPESTVAVLDGGAAPTGDSTTFTFASPLQTSQSGFQAKLSLGIGYSYQFGGQDACGSGQVSLVDVSATRMTSCAGSYDDGQGANGALITVGGVGDSLDNPVNPYGSGGTDDELYNLAPFLHDGDTSLRIDTSNPSQDDDIFLSVISISAQANVTDEICDNGIDDNHNGLVDMADPGCAPPVPTTPADTAPPVVNCDPADGAWHATDVSIACTASDAGSGLEDASDSSFSLSTSVPAGTEDANAATGTHQVCDVAGNCTTAGPVAGNMVDRKAPSTSCDSADGSWHGSNVTLSCSGTDGGSGMSGTNPVGLSTSVPSGADDSNAATSSDSLCDAVGNCSSVGPISGNKIDRKAPSTSCDSADGQWHASNVTLNCTGTDTGSGMAGTNPVGLSTNVASGSEDANAATSSGTLCDAVGNCASVGPISGNQVDRKAPTITLTNPVDGASYVLGSAHAAAFGCTDGGSLVASCLGTVANGSNVDTATVGPHTFTVNSADNVGNNSPASSVSYGVIWAFGGFYSPVNNKDANGNYVLNVAKAGSAIPVKFSLGGNQGLNVMAGGSPSSGTITCSASASSDAVEQTVTAGGSSLSYDSTTGTYNYVWKTDKTWSGTCRQLTVKLADGTVHKASFSFTR